MLVTLEGTIRDSSSYLLCSQLGDKLLDDFFWTQVFCFQAILALKI